MKKIFITGTNTGVGKTYFTYLLLKSFREQGVGVRVCKPIASGAELHSGVLKNEDALQYAELFPELSYEDINPICFKPAIAPNIAATIARQNLTIESVNHAVFPILTSVEQSDDDIGFFFLEGAGGWKTPLNEYQTYADWVSQAKMPVIIVTAMELGCINHTLLTYEAILAAGVPVLGWVANTPGDKMEYYTENINTLKAMLPIPCLLELDSKTRKVPLDLFI